MKVELLFFDGCPNYETLLPRLRTLMEREGMEGQIELRRVDSIDAAEEERFLGSPTIRVDGVDVDPGAAARSDFGVKCRLYRSDEGTSGAPPERWIVEALHTAAGLSEELRGHAATSIAGSGSPSGSPSGLSVNGWRSWQCGPGG